MTAPFAQRAATELPYGVGLTWAADVFPLDLGEPLTLDVIEVTLEEDEEWWPRCRATVMTHIPDIDGILDILDPRSVVLPEVRIWATYTYSDGTTDTQQVAKLYLENLEANRADGTMTLEAYSREMILEDQTVPVDRGWLGELAFATANEVFVGMVGMWDSDSAPLISTVSDGVKLPSEYPMTFNPFEITDPAEQLRAWADSIKAVVYCDALGRWRLDPRPSITATSKAVFTTGPLGNISGVKEGFARANWANRVIISYGENDAGVEIWSEAGSDVYGNGDRYYSETREKIPAGSPTAEGQIADSAPQAVLDRLASRGESLEITVAPYLWLHVGNTIAITIRDQPQRRALVAAIRHQSATATTTIRTRIP